jgi:endoglucanase
MSRSSAQQAECLRHLARTALPGQECGVGQSAGSQEGRAASRDPEGVRPPAPSAPPRGAGSGIPRRGLVAGLAALAAPVPALANPVGPFGREWGLFKDRFLAPEGRVCDTGNGGISHSEGQGIGMLAAVWANDRACFRLMGAWTRETLRRRDDGLFSWRYQPGLAKAVDDPNNATDGDLLIALALFAASARWHDPACRSAALEITHGILRKIVRPAGRHVVLLPGAHGFEHSDRIVLNPSYYIFPAIERMAKEVPDPAWRRLRNDGLALLSAGRFGRWGLTPDWMNVPRSGGPLAPSQDWPARFSFDAVRVPLYMCWAGLQDEPAVTSAISFWSSARGSSVPAWTDLRTGEVAPYPQSSGMASIARYVSAMQARRAGRLELPSVALASDYYAAALTMLTRVAAMETGLLAGA